MPAIARGLISRTQLAGLFYSVSAGDAERVFRAAQTKNIGTIFVTSADINAGNKAKFDEEMVEQFTYSLKGLWPECGCYDHDECSDEDSVCQSEEEICVNTDGSYSCINPSTALGLSSRARAIGCFNSCDENAECILGKCRCPAGYDGTGQDCNAPANDVKFVIPIRQRPTIKNGKCVDAYWNEISQIKDVIVVLEIYSIKWMSCINLLDLKGVIIYAKIDAKGGVLKDPAAVLTKKFENLKRVFRGKVNPYLTNPGRTFETDWVYKAMENARNQNLKLGIQAADAEWSVDCVIKKKIDLVVVFKDPVKKFTQSCGEGGPGPFCATRNARNVISEMVAALNQGKVSKDVFAVIVYNSHSRDVKAVLELSEIFKIDRVWLTERPFYSTVRPKLLGAVKKSIAAGKSIDQSRCGCRDINECESDICHSNALCKNTEGSFECSCGSGFDGNGRVCLTINECTKGTHDCSNNADCLDTVDGFICACSSGFTGDGKTCVDVNECANKNICGENSICKNTSGSFSCNCAPGFESQDDTCVDIDECVHELHNCAAQALCENKAGSFTCSCKEGFVGSGVICNDIDECTSENACAENALCTNSFGSFTCTCARGFEGDGKSECFRNTCKECSDGAICSPTSEGCICKAGTRGPATKCEEQKLIVPIRSIPLVSLKARVVNLLS